MVAGWRATQGGSTGTLKLQESEIEILEFYLRVFCVLYTCIHVHTGMCASMKRSEVDLSHRPQFFETGSSFLRQGLLLSLELTNWSVWLGSELQESACLHLPRLGLWTCPSMPFLCGHQGIQAEALSLDSKHFPDQAIPKAVSSDVNPILHYPYQLRP